MDHKKWDVLAKILTFYILIVIQWQYGACILPRRSPVPHESSWRSNQGGRNCGVQDWGQRDPHCAQSAQNSREVSKLFDANFTDFEPKTYVVQRCQQLCFFCSIYFKYLLWNIFLHKISKLCYECHFMLSVALSSY